MSGMSTHTNPSLYSIFVTRVLLSAELKGLNMLKMIFFNFRLALDSDNYSESISVAMGITGVRPIMWVWMLDSYKTDEKN